MTLRPRLGVAFVRRRLSWLHNYNGFFPCFKEFDTSKVLPDPLFHTYRCYSAASGATCPMMQVYDRRVTLGHIQDDPHQRSIVEQFSALNDQLVKFERETNMISNLLWPFSASWLTRRPEAPLGLYLYGDVGKEIRIIFNIKF